MAYASDIHSNAHANAGFAGLMANFRKARAQHRVYRQTVNELSALSGRELADLGITAGEIRFIAREAAKMAG